MNKFDLPLHFNQGDCPAPFSKCGMGPDQVNFFLLLKNILLYLYEAKLYYTSQLGLVWDRKMICWDSSQSVGIHPNFVPSQTPTIHPSGFV